jgi:hypothetical protein
VADPLAETMPRGPGFLLRVLQKHVIGEPEAEVIREIACVLDLIDDLQAELDRAGAVVDGKPNPCVVELRQQRLVLVRLLALLPPAEPTVSAGPPSPRSVRASHAAKSRWAEHNRIRRGAS